VTPSFVNSASIACLEKLVVALDEVFSIAEIGMAVVVVNCPMEDIA
jgi:hypothetical protein